MRSDIFNSTFENMLRMLLLLDVYKEPMNMDRIAALDFICIYGKKCKVLEKNLHGDNEFGFSEFTGKREKIRDALTLAVRNDFVSVQQNKNGFTYQLNDRGKKIVTDTQTPYAKAYAVGAKIVCRKFSMVSDSDVLKYISDQATEKKEG